jgi:hypothetical protein
MIKDIIIKEFISKVSKDIFIISFITFVVFFILESLERGFVTNYINVNALLVICFLSGLIAAIFKEKTETEWLKANWKFYILTGLVSLFGMVIILLYWQGNDWISLVASVIGGIVIFLVQWVISNK